MNESVNYNRFNRRVWIFLKTPDFALEPQMALIFQHVQQVREISRFELIKAMIPVLKTKSTISKVVSHAQKRLVEAGLVEVIELEEYKLRLERRKDTEMNGQIRPNDRGGYEISINQEPFLGNYATEQDARIALRRNAVELKEMTTVDPEALVS